jgi:Tfp pilus assembly protein PilO
LQKFIALLEKFKWNHVALVILASAAFFYFTLDTTEVDSKTEGLEGAKKQTAVLEKKVTEAQEFEKEFDAKKKQYQDLVKQLQDSQGALPKQFFMPDLLADLLSEARKVELEITEIKPDTREEQQDQYNSLGFTLQIKGTFVQFFIFLDRLATMRRLVHVISYSISRDSNKTGVALGGEEGPFSAMKLSGGKTPHPGVSITMRIVTFRYRGGGGG